MRTGLVYSIFGTLFLGGFLYVGNWIHEYERCLRSPDTEWYAVPFDNNLVLQNGFRGENAPGYNDFEKYLEVVSEKNGITDFTRQKPAKICLPDIDRNNEVADYPVNELEPCGP